jgi:hypothetical protein
MSASERAVTLTQPTKILWIDIDGLRPDVFADALENGKISNLAGLLGKDRLVYPVLAPAPSITFTSQASIFTGSHPSQHGISGNQFFDRFGLQSHQTPRQYAFDVGDTLAADDAVRVFSDNLASNCLQTPTIYEILAEHGWQSVVVGHMYARGASQWLRPSLTNLARFTKGGNLFGLSAAAYDRHLLKKALEYIGRNGFPDLLTLYFMGVDHESHRHGPQSQAVYLTGELDPMIGELAQALNDSATDPLTIICSDHGQIGVPPDDQHSLRLAFPFEREMGHLFDALGLDVHDYPGEDPNCDAVVASNGGMAQVYLRNRKGAWADRPLFERDILPVGRAFWEAHKTGRHAPELRASLAAVLVRDVENEGWQAAYRALTTEGHLQNLSEWFESQPADLFADPSHRIQNLAGPMSGDILLVSDYQAGFYFGSPLAGVHGGLHPEDSYATLACGWPACLAENWQQQKEIFLAAILSRCQKEEGRQASTADLVTGLLAMLALDGRPLT